MDKNTEARKLCWRLEEKKTVNNVTGLSVEQNIIL